VTDTPNTPNANRSVLAINSGSSSTKYALFTLAPEPTVLCRGSIDDAASATTVEEVLEGVVDSLEAYPLAGIGHRIVHGGPALFDPLLVTEELLAQLRRLVHFAPNHLPAEIQLIETARRLRPDVPQLVCFDTAFHSGLPDVARRLPIPHAYDLQGVRRYGFHGLSYTFLLHELGRRAGQVLAGGKVVLMHLGNGSSLAAVRDGRCIDTSMGFTPIGGVVMSTRSGDLDPGVVTYIARSAGFDADRVEHELSHRSGLEGLSGGVRDMRDLVAREANDEDCRLAVSIYCYEITKRIGAYAAALGGLDALVFSGGIGEHASIVRARICSGLEFLGIEIDGRHNAEHAPVISTSTARVAIHVIPADEEVVIARAAYQLLH
jgi:acetate kinase